jgi:glutaredoxin 3
MNRALLYYRNYRNRDCGRDKSRPYKLQPTKKIMKKTIIYSKKICPYCVKAKILLDRKGLKYEEISIENNDELRNEMIEKSGGRMTVPQIFIGDHHVGGCDDLYAAEEAGELDKIISN